MSGSWTEGLVKRARGVDPLAEFVQKRVARRLTRDGQPTPLKQALNGVWLGHPLHPALTDVPLGSWTAAALMDVAAAATGSDGLQTGADAGIAIGCLGAVGAAATGAADWSDLSGEARRAGMLHALLNTVVLLMNLVSLKKRWSGSRGSGVLWSLAALGIGSFSAYLGGELVSSYGSGVTHEVWPEPPQDFTAVLDEADLKEGKLTRAVAGEFPVCLLRRGAEVSAIGEWCTHLGGPLSEGTLAGDAVTCPWHGSQFDVRSGEVLCGPATIKARRFEARIRNGKVEVKLA